ncbi:uncharacterized protein UV8b_04734 [Ustilaginoidea virens]|uniref:Uncharacterized protein n=1 Tax=Ustilaginoidea virens TaxID=1159556 RepID=A0A063BP44_USTVR|nr:uncharacterized protein UV8b_04734 [Ustilaginoidea virens]QUC20493.1 hypothetical protein UV8b_04734 [Ustilaginoidea virens]GAO15568.1 hypothetical protein UVI_02050010 [Ustilaginoidea virens]
MDSASAEGFSVLIVLHFLPLPPHITVNAPWDDIITHPAFNTTPFTINTTIRLFPDNHGLPHRAVSIRILISFGRAPLQAVGDVHPNGPDHGIAVRESSVVSVSSSSSSRSSQSSSPPPSDGFPTHREPLTGTFDPTDGTYIIDVASQSVEAALHAADGASESSIMSPSSTSANDAHPIDGDVTPIIDALQPIEDASHAVRGARESRVVSSSGTPANDSHPIGRALLRGGYHPTQGADHVTVLQSIEDGSRAVDGARAPSESSIMISSDTSANSPHYTDDDDICFVDVLPSIEGGVQVVDGAQATDGASESSAAGRSGSLPSSRSTRSSVFDNDY